MLQSELLGFCARTWLVADSFDKASSSAPSLSKRDLPSDVTKHELRRGFKVIFKDVCDMVVVFLLTPVHELDQCLCTPNKTIRGLLLVGSIVWALDNRV